MLVTQTRVQTYVHNARFPATRQHLMETAELNAAPRDILDTLGSIEEGKYKSIDDVMDQVRDIDG